MENLSSNFPPFKGIFGALIAVVAVQFFSGEAQAGNDDGVLVGGQAAMTGGALTATVSDGSAIWFNPAGLVNARAQQIDIGANAFTLRLHSISNVMSSPNQTVSGVAQELSVVPTAVSYARLLSMRTVVGVGLFVPYATDFQLREELQDQDSWVISRTQRAQNTYGGIGIAHKWLPGVDIGASLFGVYRMQNTEQLFSGGSVADQAAQFMTITNYAAKKSMAVEAGVGIQWMISPQLKWGFSVRSPSLQMFRSETSFLTNGSSSTLNQSFSDRYDSSFKFNVGWVAPPRFRTGIAWVLDRGWVAFDIDLQTAMDTTQVFYARKAVVNARLGGLWQLSSHFTFGAGLFTDRDASRNQFQGQHYPISFYGGAAGLTWRSRDFFMSGMETNAQNSVEFSTTIGVRYAFGTGEFPSVSVPATYTKPSDVVFGSSSIATNEFALNLASGIYF